ncbi:hypothetical protein B0H11DRAFT_1938680 [Mycena galericulata]|nr:hypothetical protein B0H11DRAFT_1938680 [Mycena galericulata]
MCIWTLIRLVEFAQFKYVVHLELVRMHNRLWIVGFSAQYSNRIVASLFGNLGQRQTVATPLMVTMVGQWILSWILQFLGSVLEAGGLCRSLKISGGSAVKRTKAPRVRRSTVGPSTVATV